MAFYNPTYLELSTNKQFFISGASQYSTNTIRKKRQNKKSLLPAGWLQYKTDHSYWDVVY